MKTTLDELQAFVAVVDTGSITAAAEQLGLTVSAASRTLGRLEESCEPPWCAARPAGSS